MNDLQAHLTRIHLFRDLTAILLHVGRNDPALASVAFRLAALVGGCGDVANTLPEVARLALGKPLPVQRLVGGVFQALIMLRDVYGAH